MKSATKSGKKTAKKTPPQLLAAQAEAKRRLALRAVNTHRARAVGGVKLSNEDGPGSEDILLGRDGSKWRHGWIPLNPIATQIKAKKFKSDGGSSKSRVNVNSVLSGPGRSKGSKPFIPNAKTDAAKKINAQAATHELQRRIEARRKQGVMAARDNRALAGPRRLTGNQSINAKTGKVTEHKGSYADELAKLPSKDAALPAGRKVTSHGYTEGNAERGEIRDAESGHIVSSGHKSKLAATRKANAHNLKNEQDSAAADNAKSRVALSQRSALEASAKAAKLSNAARPKRTRDAFDSGRHNAAAKAHDDAAKAHTAAGNTATAQKHRNLASAHRSQRKRISGV